MNQRKKPVFVTWLIPELYSNDYQFYRQWATNAWINLGGSIKYGIKISFAIKKIIGRFNKLAAFIPNALKRRQALIVCCGAFPNYAAWPYMYTNEIIPIIWDCWPKYHDRLINAIRDYKIRTLFCTSSQVIALIKLKYPKINAFWLPEGIDIKAYIHGNSLEHRPIDVLELGRLYAPLHYSLEKSLPENVNHRYSDKGELLFKTFDDLTRGLADAKITICYPRCDTHPEMAGDIETLTQRYWECMLSGTLIVGRAPKELIEFCGYNPVIELKNHTADEIIYILNNIRDFQELCDKNRKFVEKNCSWENRISKVIGELKNNGYHIN